MGCDIRGWVEVRESGVNTDYWQAVISLEFAERDYGIFAYLFGIRNPGLYEPLADRRGLPDSISYIAEKNSKSWEGTAHSHSWIGYEEIVKSDWESYFHNLLAHSWEAILECMAVLAKRYGNKNVRMVVWFDS